MPNQPSQSHGVGISILRYAPSRFIEPLLGVITIPILTRLLEPAGYGDFKTLILTAGLARIIGFDWINNCAIRFYRPMETDLRRYHTNLLSGLLLGTVTLGAIWIASTLVAGQPGSGDSSAASLVPLLLSFAPWMYLTAVAEGFARNGEMIFRAMQRPWAFSTVRTGIALSRHGLGLILLILASNNLAAYFGGWAVGALIIALSVWIITGAWRHLSARMVSTDVVRTFLVFGLPITLVVLANTAQTTGIRYILQYFLGSEATGLFSAAYDLGGVPVLVFQSIVMLGLYPLAIDAFEKHGQIDGIVHDGLRYFFLAAIPLVLLLGLLAEPALTVFAGTQYTQAWPVLAVSCVGTLAYGLSQYFSLWFLVSKRTGRWAAINLTAAALNIVFSSMLVPKWGYIAAAWCTAAAHGLILLGSIALGHRPAWKDLPIRSLGYAVLGCVPMILVWYAVGRLADFHPLVHCLAVSVVGWVVYLGMLWSTGELMRERRALAGLLSRIRASRTRNDRGINGDE